MLGWIITLIVGILCAIGGSIWYDKSRYDSAGAKVLNGLGIVIAGVAAIILIVAPMACAHNVNDFIETKTIMTQVVSTSDYADIAVVETIVDENEWLASARASVKTFGIFSFYKGKGIEDLTPIMIPKTIAPTP